MDNFAINFKRLRESMNYTQDYVAYQLGVPLHVVESWENGTAMPDSNVLPQIANIFRCSIDLLFQNPNTINLTHSNEDDMEKDNKFTFSLLQKGKLTRNKARSVMIFEISSGLLGSLLSIIIGLISSIAILKNEGIRTFAILTIIITIIGIVSFIFCIKKLVDIYKDKL